MPQRTTASLRRLQLATTTAACLLLSASSLTSQIHRTPDSVRRADLALLADHERLIMVPMRDGVRLATDVYTPKEGEGPFPTIFWRTPYNFSPLAPSNPSRPSALLKFALDAVERGYAFVVQNERGKFFSEGDWEILGRPRTDGYDALTWIAEQSFSNGKVATLGCSSTAEWQMGLAAMGHPAHAAAVPMGQGAGIGRVGGFYEQGNFYRGGAVQLPMVSWLYGNQNLQRPTLPADISDEDRRRLATYYDLAPKMPTVDWDSAFPHLPLIEFMANIGGPPGEFEKLVQRTPDDPAWYEGGLYHDSEDFGVPALWVNSWYDLSVAPNVALFQHASENSTNATARNNQYMIIAPTLHCAQYRLETPLQVGAVNMGDVSFGLDEMLFDWLDVWTRDEGSAQEFAEKYAKVRYFSMGTNEWRDSPAWPPEGTTKRTLYLVSDGDANTLHGGGRLSASAPSAARADSYLYDPLAPVPTIGGNFCCLGNEPEGPFDQREVQARSDVLVYTTQPFEESFDLAGSIEVILYVSSDAPDTDFTAKLTDVDPSGRAINLDDAILRARYREGFDKKLLMEEGEIYELRIGPLITANVFRPGHRLRLEISSSNFPRYDRNLNTGGNNWDETEPRVARNSIHHSPQHPSRIVLDVLPADP